MNRVEMTYEVKNALGIFATHPLVTPVDYVVKWLNQSMNRVLRLAIRANGYAPLPMTELHTEWMGTTTVNQPYVAMPDEKLAVLEMFSFDKTAADEFVDRPRLVGKIAPRDWTLSPKDSTTADWPRRWTMIGRQLRFGPYPTAAYVTDYLLHGVSSELPLSADASVPLVIDETWHQIYVTETMRIAALRLGWYEKAQALGKEVADQIGAALDISVLENMLDDDPIMLPWYPEEYAYR
jgi:hypothetical protein